MTALLRRLRYFFHRRTREAELAEEIRLHRELKQRELEAGGVDPAIAARSAGRALGSVASARDGARDVWIWPWLRDLTLDIRLAGRRLRRDSLFTVAAVSMLGIGIGATTGLFSVVHAVLLRPFPYRGVDRMIQARLFDRTGFRGALLVTARQFLELRQLDAFDAVATTDSWVMTLTGQEWPQPVNATYFSANAFDNLGTAPALGRAFTAADGAVGEEPRRVVVLGYGFWQSHYGGRPEVLGQMLQLNHQLYEVIGVAPPRFWDDRDVFVPMHVSLDPQSRWGVWLRRAPGVSLEAAEARLQAWWVRAAADDPVFARDLPDLQVRIRGFVEARVGDHTAILVLLFSAAALLLAVACANVSILLLSRNNVRGHEIGVRRAMGANRYRLVRQLLTESTVLSLAGAVLGVGLAYGLVPVLIGWLPASALPTVTAVVTVNLPVLLFGVAVALATGIAFGLLPAFRLSRSPVGALLLSETPRGSAGPRRRRTYPLLLAGQVAVTMMLLSAAGVTLRVLLDMASRTLGYDPEHVLIAALDLPETHQTTREARGELFERLRERLAQIPRVESVAIGVYTSVPPLSGFGYRAELEGQPADAARMAAVHQVSPEYFAALKIPVRRGRPWTTMETRLARPVAVVNETLARRWWPQREAIGQHLQLPDYTSNSQFILAAPTSAQWLEVVGVVGDTPNRGLRDPLLPAVYVPFTLMLGDSLRLILRTADGAGVAAPLIREAVHAVDPNQAVGKVTAASAVLQELGFARERVVAALLLSFAIFALLLAAMGLYSVVTYSVSQRTKEFGIRLALGARTFHVIQLTLTAPLAAIAAGLTIGLGGSVAASRASDRWALGGPIDPFVLSTTTGIVVCAALLVAALAARRAAAIQPATALRSDG